VVEIKNKNKELKRIAFGILIASVLIINIFIGVKIKDANRNLYFPPFHIIMAATFSIVLIFIKIFIVDRNRPKVLDRSAVARKYLFDVFVFALPVLIAWSIFCYYLISVWLPSLGFFFISRAAISFWILAFAAIVLALRINPPMR